MKHVVFYDAQCPLCFYLKKTLSLLDWKDKIRWSSVQTIEETPYAFLRNRPLLEKIHMITDEGELYSGAKTIRKIFLSLPLTKVFGYMMFIPFVMPVAEIIYSKVSSSRIKWFGRYEVPRFE
ncbi:thiol-disulfide oxidoreductase DCC family protein [Metabacillus sp. 84]|uniref:thiol-disulfide oxidoreductase DCC family protein n=1 Tax=Metabacillus sp. 84 TaxID=3404705 RepID=UPI003CF59783